MPEQRRDRRFRARPSRATLIRDNIITGNRTGIDINNCNGHTIRNNVIDVNRTGLIFRNQTDNLTSSRTRSPTTGPSASSSSMPAAARTAPVQTALNCTFSNNDISGNWYGQIVDRQTGGSLPAPGDQPQELQRQLVRHRPRPSSRPPTAPSPATRRRSLSRSAARPFRPAAEPDILGAASANFDFTPLPRHGTDTNVETTAGRGTNGFQGDFSSLYVTARAPRPARQAASQEGVSLVKPGGTVNVVGRDVHRTRKDRSSTRP